MKFYTKETKKKFIIEVMSEKSEYLESHPKISIIIPCYNAESFLRETLESIFVQTFRDYEVILIDDGSTDNTAKIIQSFGSQVRAKFGLNQGASSARNQGTQLASGQYIQYLDADDVLHPDALEKRFLALETGLADVAYSNWQYLEENEAGDFCPGKIISRKIEDFHVDPQIALFTNFWAPPAAILYRREIVDAIGGWSGSLPVIQDARFLMDAAFVGARFVHVSKVGASYRVHRGSLSRRNHQTFMQDCLQNAIEVEEKWHRQGKLSQEQQAALENVYGYVTRYFFEHDRLKFYEVLDRIHSLNPNYLPSGPASLRQLSKWFGYERAEAIALNYRRFKKLFRA
ncbi:glycosyltransferase family 2 protein [Egbenema bharatensis]|uniref:glycosyltransferase family 2 protein n=1 Tax=Egbenema bharatensis TaxID=3463334 RepID=UPI003A8BF366